MLPKIEGFVMATLGSLDTSAHATVVSDLAKVEEAVLSRSDLRGALSDTAIKAGARGAIVRDLFAGKISDPALRIVIYASTHASAQEFTKELAELSYVARVHHEFGRYDFLPLSLMQSRRRITGYADAVLDGVNVGDYAAFENELFKWARAIEGNLELRRLLLDRDAPLESRLGATEMLLSGKVQPLTLDIARFAIIGGRPRDLVGTLDHMVNYIAVARDWRVARVRTARKLEEADKSALVSSLTTLTGKNIELQIADDPTLLGGVLVEVGDLRLDASTRGRLGQLREAVAAGHVATSLLNTNDK